MGATWILALAGQLESELVEELGTEKLEALRRAGAAMNHPETVAFLHAEARALGQAP